MVKYVYGIFQVTNLEKNLLGMKKVFIVWNGMNIILKIRVYYQLDLIMMYNKILKFIFNLDIHLEYVCKIKNILTQRP